ncbi:amino acid decarboxylase [Paenibacillus sp. CAA11]|uniref:aminotransferase class I/II-fold pyridoxal phosphate-dependent enzyme n=1 Tax=Paenibacillus sp. CAA11 TaxID=1532905 RepID=UPI000D3CA5C4|nr:aminotransferase class I/II-fold pyridoxal phosphate-dependent enzyme [Paenibacillus sp. CAA11]AWB42791.1 amino acid decarboxylase [Paenibacillus sp. CAA11]
MDRYEQQAPLLQALNCYAARKDASFHVPGHKDGAAYRAAAGGLTAVLREAMTIDATEITGLDDLHHPEEVIAEAQRLAAVAFGAEETYFLVGGSTSGNLALILTACASPGDVLLVQRNVHKSVIHGLMLARAQAVFLAPEVDGTSGLATIPSVETVCEALRRYPGAKGVLVTHPNYYGMGGSLRPLAEACHAAGLPLLVDEAHGAHYGLAAGLPESALAAGADGVVQSTHKMLTAMTMGAMLHVQGPRLDRGLLRQRLGMIQSSSPSYLIMASLDLSRSYVQQEGKQRIAEALSAIQQLKEELRSLKYIGWVECTEADGLTETAGRAVPFYSTQDPFKLVIYDKAAGLSGSELQMKLEELGCVPEMSDPHYVVLAFSLSTSEQDIVRLREALAHIDLELVSNRANPNYLEMASVQDSTALEDDENKRKTLSVELSTWNILENDPISEPISFSMEPPKPALLEEIPINESKGRLAGEMVIPYPPGIPLLYPGERIKDAHIKQWIQLKNTGAKFQGIADPSLSSIKVYQME